MAIRRASRTHRFPLHALSPLPSSPLLALLVLLSLHSSLLKSPSSALALSQDEIGSILSDGISFDGIGPGEDFGDYEERYGVSDEDEYNANKDGEMDMEGVSGEWDEEQPEAAMPGVLELDDVTLPKVADGRQKLLLFFYAPWDRFCKEMVPIFKDVARTLASHSDVMLAKVDGDRYWKLSSRYDAASYPHLVYFDEDNQLGINYGGERTATALVHYMLHGQRRGPLLPALQAAVRAFQAGGSGEQREAAIAQAEALVAGMTAADVGVGQLYIKAMKGAVAYGDDFLRKEARRLESSLEGGGLPPSMYTKFRRQITIAKELDPTIGDD